MAGRAGSSGRTLPRRAARAARRRPVARRRSHLPCIPHADRCHRPDQRVPRPIRDRRSSSDPTRSRSCPSLGPSSRSSCVRRSSRGCICVVVASLRGGLRWSDRPEDFRTEVLGLVKAQMVKNAVIVPTGAKGGFVIKASTIDPGRSRRRARRGHRPVRPVRAGAARRHRQRGRRRDRASARRRSSTTTTTRISSSPPTRARRRSATSPTRSPPSTTSGSATRSPRAEATATTTRRWASPPVALGRAFAATPV